MEIEFDKEIDAILRKARGGEAVTSFDSHIDADEIAAFAENLLPEKLKQNFTAHFADCTRCRKILSNVIALNSEAELETASSAVLPEIVEAKTPWYRKLFAFPQAAYTMGALVVLLSGFFGYLVLKNVGPSNSDVSYSVDKSEQMQKSAPAATVTPSDFSTANTNSNAAMKSLATPAPTNSAPLAQSNTSVPAMPTDKKPDAAELNKPAPVQPMIAPQKTPAPSDATVDVNKDLAKTQSENEATKPTAGAVRDKREDDEKKLDKLPINGRNTNDFEIDGQSNNDSVKPQPAPKTERSAPMSMMKKKASEAGAARTVGGKTFNNVGGIWFDSAYGKQKTKTVSRGSKDYQKLDSGLRSIADQFGGTVVIVWNGKAYRIQ